MFIVIAIPNMSPLRNEFDVSVMLYDDNLFIIMYHLSLKLFWKLRYMLQIQRLNCFDSTQILIYFGLSCYYYSLLDRLI